MTNEYPYQHAVRDVTRVGDEHGLDAERRIAKYQGNLGLTVNQAREIVDVLWADAPEAEKHAAALLCHSYHLNPLANHVFLIPYNTKQTDGSFKLAWSRVMGIKAKRLLASRPRPGTTEYRPVSYEDFSPRIMTEAEQVKIFGKPDPDNVCFITILKDTKTGATAYGTGKWPKAKQPKGVDKGNSQENMAGIRSESAALDRLRPGEMPRDTVVVDEAYVEGDSHPVPPESEAGTTASPEPEITDQEIDDLWGTQAQPKAKPEAKEKPVETSHGKSPEPKTPEQFKVWCNKHAITGKVITDVCDVDLRTACQNIGTTVNTLREKLGLED